MTVTELIESLGELDPDAEVLMASQPSYPLQNEIARVSGPGETLCASHEYYGCEDCEADRPNVVYIVEGSAPEFSPYAPRSLW